MARARPAVQYATTVAGLESAYQALGAGPIDVVIVPGLSANLDWNAECPFYGGYLRRLPHFARTIVVNRRGARTSRRSTTTAPGTRRDRMPSSTRCR